MTSRRYHYVGPEHILEDVAQQPPGSLITCEQDVLRWLQTPHIQPDRDQCITVTFTVSTTHILRVADRHSEHVACAAGGPVLAAGELTFEVDEDVRVVTISNQSTGFCPEPDCWEDIKIALDRAKITHPGHLTHPFIFRLCVHCGQRNLVKEQWFECAVCQEELPQNWNFGSI